MRFVAVWSAASPAATCDDSARQFRYIEETDAPRRLSDADIPEGFDTRTILRVCPPTRKKPAGKPASDNPARSTARPGLHGHQRDRFFDRIRDLSGEGRPILVFSEYADTMEYIRDSLAKFYGEQVASYSGGAEASTAMANGFPPRAGDHRRAQTGDRPLSHLHGCRQRGVEPPDASALINYDLPWNPSKVEQRIGRIDRIGQREGKIKVYNLLLKNSIDEKVYGALRSGAVCSRTLSAPCNPCLPAPRSC